MKLKDLGDLKIDQQLVSDVSDVAYFFHLFVSYVTPACQRLCIMVLQKECPSVRHPAPLRSVRDREEGNIEREANNASTLAN